MLIDFDKLNKISITNLNGGKGIVTAGMSVFEDSKVMISKLPPDASIGTHTHTTSCEYNYCISGSGKAVCDGTKEALTTGKCHYCPIGSTHSITNDGTDDLVLFTVVVEKS